MAAAPRTVLITGCSDGELGSSLALPFHTAGLKVYATARNPAKLTQCTVTSIDMLTLDLLRLDILVDNAGAEYFMPISDVDIPDAKKLFDLNVRSYIEMTQTCPPLLLKSSYGGMVVNQTSVGSVVVLPLQGIYTASMAAMAMISDTLRLELGALGATVVDLKTGFARSNLVRNHTNAHSLELPTDSIYGPAREMAGKALNPTGFGGGMPTMDWATAVVGDLLKRKPPMSILRGEHAWLARLIGMMPQSMFDGMLKKMTGFGVVEKIMNV